MDSNSISGKRLRRMRERQKMTQLDLAAALNVEVDVVQSYEKGRFVPGANVLNKLTAILRCEEADLYE